MKNIIILVGASGSGKTTLGQYLKSINIPELISHTTREKRTGEIEGTTYYYVNKEEFLKIEKIEETEYAGNFYCLSKKEVDNKLMNNKVVFSITDIHGLEQINRAYEKENIISIYLHISPQEMKRRMIRRGDKSENIEKRLKNAMDNNEFSNALKCKYVIDTNSIASDIINMNRILKKENLL